VTSGGEALPESGAEPRRAAPVLGWRGRIDALMRAIMRSRPMRAVQDVMRAYDRGGGGMLAGALAYFAFFSLVPALLLFVSLLGIIIEDEALRASLIDSLVNQLDPIRDVAIVVIDGLADSGRTGTVVGVLGLLWAGSGFYGALQGAMQRMFPGPGGRDFFRTRFNGVVTVALVLAVLLIAVVVIFGLPFVTEWLDRRCTDLAALEVPVVDGFCSIDFVQLSSAVAVVGAMGIAFGAVLTIYLVIPTDGPSFREAFLPAVLVGLAIGGLTSLFGWIAPLLVRNWVTLGIVGNVFIALIWLNLVMQALVYGAAFARLRRDRARIKEGMPRL
jgi:membrane protein